MDEVYDLAKRIRELIGHDPKELSSPDVRVDTGSLGDCSRRDLLESTLYIFCPDDNLQKNVKNELQGHIKNTKLHFVITTRRYCDTVECRSHYVDPFETAIGDEHVFVDEFPENINGSHVHFLNQKNYAIFESIRGSDK